jgi:putative redox protein
MNATVTWTNRLAFSGTADSGFTVPLDAETVVGGDENGFRPMELFLIGLGGCTGMDTISILKKKQQDVTAFEIRVQADRKSDHPKVFSHILVEYVISGHHLDRNAAERAVELSVSKYCPAQAMLSASVSIEHKITLVDAE